MEKQLNSKRFSKELLQKLSAWWLNPAIPQSLRSSQAFLNPSKLEEASTVGETLAKHQLLFPHLKIADLHFSEPKDYNQYLIYSEELSLTSEEKEKAQQDLEKLLQACDENAELATQVEDAFFAPLVFGTAGLRGLMGSGLNRMNVYTLATASAGIAKWLLDTYGEEACRTRGVVMGYDTRLHSSHFALVGSLVFAAYGIHVHLYPQYCATPLLAYAIKPLTALAGLMVTASHNPKAYNGYKIYGADGIQIGSEEANAIAKRISEHYAMISFEEAVAKKLIHNVSPVIENDYLHDVLGLLRPSKKAEELKIVYTAMHGTGAKYVLPLLENMGFNQVALVEEQIQPDGHFPTAPAPNPEFEKALEYTFKKCQEIDADLALATDPDADRLSLVIKSATAPRGYKMLTGNQIGSLLTYFTLCALKEKNALAKNGAMVKSIVTDHLGAEIAESFGIHAEECLTGFKNICGKIREFEEKNSYKFLFGYEESIGYAFNPNVLDKDGISAALLMASAAAFYREQGKSLEEVLNELYEKFGTHVAYTENLVREGKKGMDFMQYMMENYRKVYPEEITLSETQKAEIFRTEDFLTGQAFLLKKDGETRLSESYSFNFERSNVLRYTFTEGLWYALRPSGTEPKLKIYFHAKGQTEVEAFEKLASLKANVMEKIESLEADFLKNYSN